MLLKIEYYRKPVRAKSTMVRYTTKKNHGKPVLPHTSKYLDSAKKDPFPMRKTMYFFPNFLEEIPNLRKKKSQIGQQSNACIL